MPQGVGQWLGLWVGRPSNWAQRAGAVVCMDNTHDYSEAERKLTHYCGILIDRGNHDPVAYEFYARAYLRPWMGLMLQTVEVLAEAELLEGSVSADTASILRRMRAAAERSLERAIADRNPASAARAAGHLCGVGLALEATEAPAP